MSPTSRGLALGETIWALPARGTTLPTRESTILSVVILPTHALMIGWQLPGQGTSLVSWDVGGPAVGGANDEWRHCLCPEHAGGQPEPWSPHRLGALVRFGWF